MAFGRLAVGDDDMRGLIPGDRVISDRYGPGKVTSDSTVPGCVDVYFSADNYDCIYNRFTGKRYLKIGHDTIREDTHDGQNTGE